MKTLGDFRELTADLPDDTPILTTAFRQYRYPDCEVETETLEAKVERLQKEVDIKDAAWKVLSACQCLMFNSLSAEQQEKHSQGIHRAVNYVKKIEVENDRLRKAGEVLELAYKLRTDQYEKAKAIIRRLEKSST